MNNKMYIVNINGCKTILKNSELKEYLTKYPEFEKSSFRIKEYKS